MKKIFSCLVLLHLCMFSVAQVLTGVFPSSSNISETVTLSVTGNNCSFAQGTFPPNLWLESPFNSEQIYPDSIQIVNDNQLLCTFTFTVLNTTGVYDMVAWDPSSGYLWLNNAFTLNPPLVPFQITGVTPNSSSAAQVVNLNITAQGGSFLQNSWYTSVLLFGQGTTLNAYQITPISNNQLTAQFIIPNNTAPGQYDLWVDNYIDGTSVLNNAFTITPNNNPPALVQVNPNSGIQGSQLSVNISGQNTHFGQGTSTQVWFSQGSSTLIVPNNLNINSDTQLTASLQITSSNPPGFYDVNMLNPIDGYLTLANAFQVVFNPNAPQLVSVNPNAGTAGQSIPVTLSGQNTTFTQGTATLTFTQGSSTLNTYSINITDDTHIEAMLDIPSWAAPGMYQANLAHSSLGNLSLQNAFMVTQPCNLSASVVQQACGTGPAAIWISSSNPPPYELVISGVTYTTNASSFAFYLPSDTTYELQSVSGIGACIGTIGNNLIIPPQSSASFTTPTQVCAGAEVSFTVTSVASSLQSIYYDDGTDGTDLLHTYNEPGFYIPFALFSANGCYFTVEGDTIFVEESPEVQVTQVPPTCGSNNGQINLSASGNGPFLYSVNYPQIPLDTASQFSSLAPGEYQVVVQGVNQCSTSIPVSLMAQTNGQNISGIILDNFGNGIPGAKVLIYPIGNPTPSDTATCDANGSYIFSNLLAGQYILALAPDMANGRYRMYYPAGPLWQMADTIEVNCVGSFTANIITNSVPNLSGSCALSSILYTNFIPADSIFSNTEMLIYHPANLQVAAFKLSSNAECFFSNLPDSLESAGYVLIPEIPFYSFNGPSWLFCGQSQSFNIDLNNKIISNAMLVGQKENPTPAPALVYPNPFSEQITIETNGMPATTMSVSILNSMGQEVYSRVLYGNSMGLIHRLDAASFVPGVYILRLTVGKEVYRYKLIKS